MVQFEDQCSWVFVTCSWLTAAKGLYTKEIRCIRARGPDVSDWRFDDDDDDDEDDDQRHWMHIASNCIWHRIAYCIELHIASSHIAMVARQRLVLQPPRCMTCGVTEVATCRQSSQIKPRFLMCTKTKDVIVHCSRFRSSESALHEGAYMVAKENRCVSS